jgi:hypothetical protein
MVAKVVWDITCGADNKFEPTRVLYTGTGRKYLRDRLKAEGCFKHSGMNEDIYLTQEPITALGYARERAIFYVDSPVVLVVDVDRLMGEVHYNGEYRAKAINIGSFLPYGFSIGDDGQVSERDWLNIYSMEVLVTRKTEEELRKAVREFLSASL